MDRHELIQKAQFQSKQMEIMDSHLGFVDAKTADFLGTSVKSIADDPVLAKQAANLYLRVIIEKLISRLQDVIDSVLSLDAQHKTEFFKELQRSLQGIEEDVDDEFKVRVKDIREVGKR